MTEAKQVAGMLGVEPGGLLLEVGAGSGWPALYMAGRTGCDVVLSGPQHDLDRWRWRR